MKGPGSPAVPPWRASWRAAGLAAGLRLEDLRALSFAELIQIVHAGLITSGGRRRWRHALKSESEGLRRRFQMLLTNANEWPTDSTSRSDWTPPPLKEDFPQSPGAPKESTGGWVEWPDPP